MRSKPYLLAPIAGAVLLLVACTGGSPQPTETRRVGVNDQALALSPSTATTISATIDGSSIKITKYAGVTYVADPVQMKIDPNAQPGPFGPAPTDPYAWEKMNILVPSTAVDSGPIYLVVNNAGWLNSPLGDSVPDGAQLSTTQGQATNIAAALKAGYTVVEIGTRSRGITAADGSQPGKAPAAAVDTKAAIRYLRLNDSVITGSAEKIVLTGTSGGGALSAIVGASGNAPEYLPYLKQIGAAGIDADGVAPFGTTCTPSWPTPRSPTSTTWTSRTSGSTGPRGPRRTRRPRPPARHGQVAGRAT
jgi:hypothetical protein